MRGEPEGVERRLQDPASGYSLAERDRPWSVVRKAAAEAGFDCIFVPVGNGSDARYLTDGGVEAMAEWARRGLDLAVLYARVMRRMMAQGSGYYPLALLGHREGAPRARNTDPPSGVRLAAGDYLTNETSAVVKAQLAQED